jgi:hypothetical protein
VKPRWTLDPSSTIHGAQDLIFLQVLKFFWVFILFITGIFVVTRYLLQFEYFSVWVRSEYANSPLPSYFTADEFGLTKFDEGELFLGMLGNTAVFLFALYEFGTLWETKGVSTNPLSFILFLLLRYIPLRRG